MLVKPWWIWKCSSSWEHAQALRVIIGTNRGCSQFPRQCYDLFKQWIHSLLLGSSPVTRIIPSICILFLACTVIVPSYLGSHPFTMISKIIPCVVFNKVIHITHSGPRMSFFRTPSNDCLRIALGWYEECNDLYIKSNFLPLKGIILRVTFPKVHHYGIMAIQLLATLTTDHHLLNVEL